MARDGRRDGRGGHGDGAGAPGTRARRGDGSADSSAGGRTPIYDNLGSYHMAITTRSPVAQQYFDQGLRLTYGFNHDEAIKSYTEGIRADSTCAMCWWGIAYALGPNINVPMDTGAVRPAWAALQQAVRLAPLVSVHDQAYIKALEARYGAEPVANRAPLDSAWARAIGEVSRRYPKDDDAATLHAEALMDLRPWNYWTNAGKPLAPSTLQQVAILERVATRNPNHPGACHFYIHAIEASNFAARPCPAPSGSGASFPAPGTWSTCRRTSTCGWAGGRRRSSTTRMAVHVDQEYLDARHPTGVYPIGYVPHNYHVMWEALDMTGRSAEALGRGPHDRREGAGRRGAHDPAVRVLHAGGAVHPRPLLALGRRAGGARARRPTCATRPASGTTCAGSRSPPRASSTRRRSPATASRRSPPAIPPEQMANLNSSKTLLQIGERQPLGRLAASAKGTDEAVKALREGIALEDDLTYDEPTAWALPLRQQLGAAAPRRQARPRTRSRPSARTWSATPTTAGRCTGWPRRCARRAGRRRRMTVAAKFQKVWAKADVTLASR